MKTARHQRLGAFGMTAVLGVFGGTALLAKCAPAPTPAPAPATTVINVTNDLVASVNSYRAQSGLPPLSNNVLLDNAALDHSTDMAQRRAMTHTGWDGSNAGQRMIANGYGWSTWGENVAAGQTTVNAVMQAWMNSSGHRANILSPNFNEIGVAAVQGNNGVIYWTMDFATGR